MKWLEVRARDDGCATEKDAEGWAGILNRDAIDVFDHEADGLYTTAVVKVKLDNLGPDMQMMAGNEKRMNAAVKAAAAAAPQTAAAVKTVAAAAKARSKKK